MEFSLPSEQRFNVNKTVMNYLTILRFLKSSQDHNSPCLPTLNSHGGVYPDHRESKEIALLR